VPNVLTKGLARTPFSCLKEIEMTKRSVIIEMAYNKDIAEAAFAASATPDAPLEMAAMPKIAGLSLDPSFAATPLPGMRERSAMDAGFDSTSRYDLAMEPKESTYIVRAEVDEKNVEEVAANKSVVGVFSDVVIEPTIICPGSAALGNFNDVANLLCVPRMAGAGLTGAGVLLAIVDTGINLAHLTARGMGITLDVARSWVPNPGMTPGNAPVGHGTMCAFDAAIAARQATFLDIQLLRSTATGPSSMSGVLSDGIRAYNHLISIMNAPRRPGESRSMVVSNSWGMFHPSWDFPVGNPGNYSDNPNHPFNRIVGALEASGADILFAAGNCGSNCPDGRCGGVTANAIYGANSHPGVLTIAGVDTSKTRVGYSTQGPGRLAHNKPDLSGFTHFQGSGVYAADGGTSAATPVVAGAVAALRTRKPFIPGNPSASPSAIRSIMRSTAEDLGAAGFDFDHGYGVVSGCNLAARYDTFHPREPINICRLVPHLCDPRYDFCRRYPWLCERQRIPFPPRLPDRFPPFPGPIPGPRPGMEFGDTEGGMDIEGMIAAAFEAGVASAQIEPKKSGGGSSSGGCGCSG
jgi:subtilisin family serine protease